MVEAANPTTTMQACERCGQLYRRPEWGRAYACPACGEALGRSKATAARLPLPKWAAGVVGIVLFAGCVMALTVARSGDRPQRMATPRLPMVPPQMSMDANVALPPRLEKNLRFKIRLMEADLKLEPTNGALVIRLIEAHSALALLLREKKRDEALTHLTTARRLAKRLSASQALMAQTAGYLHTDLDRLVWAGASGGMMLPQMMTGSAGAGMMPAPVLRSPTVGASPMGTPGGMYPTPPQGSSPTGGMPPSPAIPPVGAPPMVVPDTSANQPAASATPPASGVAPAVQGPMPSLPSAGMNSGGMNSGGMNSGGMNSGGGMIGGGMMGPMTDRNQQEREIRARIARLEQQQQREPDNRFVYDNLGSAYQQLAELELNTNKKRLSPALAKALASFQEALKRSRLRIHKAAFLRACGDVYEAQGNYEKQYQVTRAAARIIPYSAAVWDELQDAALRAGHYAESREAARNAREWTLPTVRAQ